MIDSLFSKRWSSFALLAVSIFAGMLGFYLNISLSEKNKLPEVSLDAQKADVVNRKDSAAPADPKEFIPEDFSEYLRLAKSSPANQQAALKMVAMLQKWAGKDPASALKFAVAEENLKIREQLRDAVLRTWAMSAPDAAAAWALHQFSINDRLVAMNAVFDGIAAREPQAAVRLAQKLYAETPTLTSDYGNIAISMLAKRGAFEEAARFAAQATGSKAQGGWTNSVFTSWAEYQPDAAASSLSLITDPDIHREAFLGLVSGWSSANPASLAAFAKSMPSGEEHVEAMRAALVQWVTVDPVKASAWMDTMEAGPELDQAAAAVATMPLLIYNYPDTALSWATSITDPETRGKILRALASQLSVIDISAARHIQASTVLTNPDDKSAFSEGVHAPPPFQ